LKERGTHRLHHEGIRPSVPTALPGTAASTISGENKADTPSATRKIVYRRSSPLLWLPASVGAAEVAATETRFARPRFVHLDVSTPSLTIVELLYGFVSILSIRHLDEPGRQRDSPGPHMCANRAHARFSRDSPPCPKPWRLRCGANRI